MKLQFPSIFGKKTSETPEKAGEKKKKKIPLRTHYPAFVIWFTWALVVAFVITSVGIGFRCGQEELMKKPTPGASPSASQEDANIKFLLEQVDKNPQDIISLVNLARAYQEAKKTTEAKVYYKRAIKVDPNYGFALLNLARILQEEKNYPEAEKLLKTAVKDEDNKEAPLELAKTYFKAGKKDEALKLLDKLLTKDPTYLEAYLQRADVLMEKGKIAKAREDLTAAGEIAKAFGSTEFADSLKNRVGAFYLDKGKYQQALKEFDAVLKKDKQNIDAYTLKSRVFLKQNQKEKAKEVLRQAIKIAQDNDNVGAKLYLTQVLQNIDKPLPEKPTGPTAVPVSPAVQTSPSAAQTPAGAGKTPGTIPPAPATTPQKKAKTLQPTASPPPVTAPITPKIPKTPAPKTGK